jgi:hypothetical protein
MNTVLVKTDVAAADLNLSIRRIEQMVDGGTPAEPALLWVFNFAVNPTGPIRSLRFWRPELQARAAGQANFSWMGISQVIDEILPVTRAYFHAGEVDQMFQIRHNTRIELIQAMAERREGNSNVYQRATLVEFLENRWLGRLEVAV